MVNPGSYPKGVVRRQEILRSALKVFEREGNAGTTMRSVAEESGLSLAGLIHYFPSRDALLTEVLRTLDESFAEEFLGRAEELGAGELLARAMETHEANPVRVWLYLTLLAATRNPDHPAVPWFRDRFEKFRAAIALDVNNRKARDEISAQVDAGYVARALLAAADGIQNQWLHDRSIDMGAHIRTTWRHLVR